MTNQQKIVAMMIRCPDDRWWHAYDYLGERYGLFIGHRAPARISELGHKHPEMIETMRDPNKPRLHIYRLRFDNSTQIRATLPNDLKSTFISEMVASGRLKGDTF